MSWSNLSNLNRGSFNLTQSSGTFTVNNGYAVGSLDVYYNGIKLLNGTDYTATNGSTFTLTNTATSGDVVEYLGISAANINSNTSRGSMAASGGQTIFNIAGGYTVGNLDLFLNGLKLVNGDDYTATNGTSITLASPTSAGDTLEYIMYGLVVASNGLQKTGDTMTGNLTVGSGSNIQFSDAVIDNNALDISIANGRLTLESNVPVSTTDQTAKTILYYTPYNGNRICLYDNTTAKWQMYSFSQLSLNLSGLAANTNFDIFIYNNNGTLTLESTAWTSSTARSTSLSLQNGVYVRTGAINRRYLGTIRTTATIGQCEDSVTKRFVWNIYNKKDRQVRCYGPSTWTYATAAWRVFNGAAASSLDIEVVNGVVEDLLLADIGALVGFPGTTTTIYYVAMAEDATISPVTSTNRKIARASSLTGNIQIQLLSRFEHIVPLGFHYYYPIEYRESGGTATMFAGDAGSYWGGIIGVWRC